MNKASPHRQRQLIWFLFLLLGARLIVSIWSTAGIRWDFANYYQTAQRITDGDVENLYRLPRSTMTDFYESIGETSPLPVANGSRSRATAEVPSGRRGFIGFPISAYLFAPIGFASPRRAVLVFKLQSAVFLVGALVLLYPAFRDSAKHRLTSQQALAVYLLIALAYAPFWFVFATGGQATPVCLFLLALFHRFFILGKPTAAAIPLSVAIMIKPFFALTLPILALAGEWRLILRLLACLLAGAVASVLLLGWPLHAEWMAVMRDASAGLAEPWWNNSGLFAIVYNLWLGWHHHDLTPAGEIRGPIAGAIGVIKVLILGYFGVLARRTGRADVDERVKRHHLVAIAIVFALCFSSIVWPHYLAFLFLPLVFWLFPPTPLPRHAEVLVWTILISTLAVQSRAAQRFVLSVLDAYPYPQAVVAALFASGTLLLTLALMLSSHDRLLYSLSGQTDPNLQAMPVRPTPRVSL